MSAYGRMVQQYTEREFARCESVRRNRIEAIKTESDARAYVQQCRATIRGIYALPTDEEKEPAHVRTIGRIEHESYAIERVIFESRPGLLVTANLYVPKERPGVTPPYPCVLGACGHSDLGKAEPRYQLFCAGLASKGFLVLIFDPISQGERFQYPDRPSPITGCVAEHVVLGAKLSLIGDYFGSWRAWDAVRALDVLLERPDADPTRVGMTGNSGGGTMTTIVTALEDRLTMIAPSCYITSYRRNLENELPADTEQIPPGILGSGYELFDHLAASAPRPTLIISKADDYFDLRGAEYAYSELHSLYSHLGFEPNIEAFVGKGGHGFDRDLREAMYGFFCKHAGVDANSREPEDLPVHTAEELQVTPDGNVMSLGSRRVIDFIRENLDRIEALRDKTPRDEQPSQSMSLPDILSDNLALDRFDSDDATTPPNETAGGHRVLRCRRGRSRFSLQTEPDISALISFRSSGESGPPYGSVFTIPKSDRGVIVVPHVGSIEEEENHPFIEHALKLSAHAQSDTPVFVVSPRGLGESLFDTCGGAAYTSLYDADFFYTSYGLMMNLPLAGGRVHDIRSVIRLLADNGYRHISIVAHGFGSLLALYAAPFEQMIDDVIVEMPFDNLASLVKSEYVECPLSFLPKDALTRYDLDDIIGFLKDRGTNVQLC